MAQLRFKSSTTVLVTGATGYVGGLLVPALLEAGATVRVLTRRRAALAEARWRDDVEIVEGDATDAGDLDHALTGADTAYYLLHSMDGSGDFVRRDREMASGFASAAAASGVRRIVYLGGLQPTDDREASPHLASRAEVGRLFLDGPVPAVVLQAGVVLGAGSASFDMLRFLTGRLPVMVTPKWVHNRVQPIAVDDAIHYLVAAALIPDPVDRTFDIAGPEAMTYEQMMQRYAAVAQLRRRVILSVPVLTPTLASRWVGLVTPVPSGVARPLMGSLIHDVVAREDDLAHLVAEPPGGRTGFEAAVLRALDGASPDAAARRAEASVAAAALLALPAAYAVRRLRR